MSAATITEREMISCPIEDGALIYVPIFEAHKRGKNWLAIIKADPQAPGGYARTFQPNGRGRYYYLTGKLKPGDAIEFGADYISSGGRKTPNRWYGVVVNVSDTALRLARCATGIEAIKLAASVTNIGAPPFIYAIYDDESGTVLGEIRGHSEDDARARFARRLRIEFSREG